MATKYTLYFSDTNKTPFDLQSYTTNGPESPSDPSIIAGATTASTTLKLWGKGLKEYGEPVFQDLIYMLENFANSSAPVFPIEGQTWYDNSSTGSPAPLPILKAYDGSAWDAIIMANGAASMQVGKELILGTDPTVPLGAVTKQLHDSHALQTNEHLTVDQNTFLDTLNLVGSPNLTGADVNQLIGIEGNVQVLLDDKISAISDTLLSPGVNIFFDNTTGSPVVVSEIRGLPVTAVPHWDDAVASKWYVDNVLSTGGDGYLSDVIWSVDAGTSPAANENALQFTVTHPSSTTIFTMGGISTVGHTHDAVDVTIDNSFNIDYGNNVQTAIEKAEEEIELLKTGGVPPSATITVQRIFEILTSPLIGGFASPISIFQVQNHNVDDNRIALTVNGVKQYTHTRGTQSINYDVIAISDGQFTGLDIAQTYEFDIAIDGGAATTVSIATSASPLVNISTHGGLVTAINEQLSALSIDAAFTISAGSSEAFTTYLSGSASSISITDPGGSPNIYLFDIDVAPDAIIAATFLSNPFVAGSPGAVPDDITIAGDVTSSFPVGKTFTIRGSVDPTYGTYDGMYSVHINGAVFDTTNTIIPIALVESSSTNTPLLPNYDPGAGSPNPAPAPSPFGDVHLSPLGGIVQVATAVNGLEGDYMETDFIGNPVPPSGFSSYVVFNYDIITGSKIESLLYV